MLARRTLVAGLVAAVGGLLALATGLAVDALLVPGASAATHINGGSPRAEQRQTCARPAPSTAAGYADLFGTLDPRVWGAADVSISVPLPDGRELWLYGDTMSGADPQHLSGFVHSSAIVQSRGCLHVADGGRQLLPNVDPDHWYWIQGASAHGTAVTMTARLIARTGPGPWGFADAGSTATFTAMVDAGGDLHLTGTPTVVAAPAPDPGPMLRLDGRPHHFGYARVVHPDLPLSGGRVLATTCQNWDGPGASGWADYRPLFSSAPA